MGAAAVVLAVVLVVFLPGVFGSGFVSDDARFIRENPAVLHPDGLVGWLRFFTSPETVDPANPQSITRPLRTLEFALDHALFGLSPVAFRLHGLLWHALASVLCLHLLRRLTGSARGALAGALLWAVHPMQVESVAWISSRADVAMGACVLGALLLELRDEGEERDARGAARGLAPALLLGAVAMLYKETAVVLPLLVFAVRLVRPRRGAPGALPQALRTALPYALVAGVYLVYRLAVQAQEGAHTDVILGGSASGTFSTMFRALGAYGCMVLLPVDPAWDWYLTPTRSLLAPSALLWAAVHLGAVGLAVGARRGHPRVAAAIALFYFPLIPVANWPFPIGIPTAERFLYLPLLGVALLVAAALRRAPRAGVPAFVCVGLLAALSASRLPDWQTEAALMDSALRHGASPRAHDRRASDLSTAAVASRRAAREAPDDDERERHLAQARDLTQRALEHAHLALEQWRRFEGVAESTSDVVVVPHLNAADLCLALDRPGEALWHAEQALRAGEDLFPQSHYNRARALLHFQRGAAALRSMQRAVELGFAVDSPAARRVFRMAGEVCASAEEWELAREAHRAAGRLTGERGSVAAVDARVSALLAAGDRRRRLETLLSEGRLEEAEAEARRVPGATADPDLAVRVFAHRGRPDGWAAALERLPADGPPRLLFWRAVCLEELGRDREAAAAYRSWLASGAGSPAPAGYDAERRARLALERMAERCPRLRDDGAAPSR